MSLRSANCVCRTEPEEMNNRSKQSGFTLTEVLLAVATLVVGMIFVAGVFPVAIYFSTVATERTIAAVTADEAFAKIKLYDIDFASPSWLAAPGSCVNFETVTALPVPPAEFEYPSTITGGSKQYYWSALCRQVTPATGARLVQVTLFVSRKVGVATRYRDPANVFANTISYPKPVRIGVSLLAGFSDQLEIEDVSPIDEATFFEEGGTIVDDATGQIYRVEKRFADTPTIRLDKNWQGITPGAVWVIPPPIGGGRYPVIEVYQKVIRF